MKSHLIKFPLLLLTVLGLYYYNSSTPLLRTLSEERFEAWLIETDLKLRTGKLNDSILVELSSTSDKLEGSWIMSYNPEKNNNTSAQKVLGLLRLLRASKAFSLHSNLVDNNGYAFSIRSGKSHFSSYFPTEVVSKNISLKSLIILMREYTKIEKTREAT